MCRSACHRYLDQAITTATTSRVAAAAGTPLIHRFRSPASMGASFRGSTVTTYNGAATRNSSKLERSRGMPTPLLCVWAELGETVKVRNSNWKFETRNGEIAVWLAQEPLSCCTGGGALLTQK
jgi:hypothetical protein